MFPVIFLVFWSLSSTSVDCVTRFVGVGSSLATDSHATSANTNYQRFPDGLLPPFSLLRDFSFQNTSEHFAIRFRQSYLIWEVCDVTAIELSSKE